VGFDRFPIQLAASETKIPLSLGNFLATPQFPEGYKAVDWYLPQLVLAIAHDSPKKQAILADIHAGKPVNSKFIIELVDDPAFTVEHSKKLGAVLYKLGTTLMKNAAEGKYQKAPAIPLMRK
jgi:hypothetical protein